MHLFHVNVNLIFLFHIIWSETFLHCSNCKTVKEKLSFIFQLTLLHYVNCKAVKEQLSLIFHITTCLNWPQNWILLSVVSKVTIKKNWTVDPDLRVQFQYTILSFQLLLWLGLEIRSVKLCLFYLSKFCIFKWIPIRNEKHHWKRKWKSSALNTWQDIQFKGHY